MAVARMLVAGRYRLTESVGSGGMGRVWLARDEMLDRDVAVKEFVPPEWMTDEERDRVRDRTLREARSAGRLNHPHVVRIYDVVHADGLPWIVMEYVPSRSMHEVVREDGPYSPAAAAKIGLAVLDALTAAHQAGVLHRDVKPHNVLIGDDGRVVLTDFGTATFVDDGAVTLPGMVLGSPQYVSPERARDGSSTPESDLWSLGATLYAAVEGRSPYARESGMATLMALATEEPDPPVRAGVLAPVLAGLLRREPADRLTAADVEQRLRMIVAADPGPARIPLPRRPESGTDQPRPARVVSAGVKVPRQSRSALVAAGLSLIAVLGIGGLLAGYLVRDDGDPAAAPASSATPSPAVTAAGFSPAVCDAPAPSALPTAPQRGAARELKDRALLPGWSYFTDGSGFYMPVPDDWTWQPIGTTYCFRDPVAGRVLVLDTGRKPTGDPVRACEAEAAKLVATGALPGYQQVGIERLPLLDKAADWEYTYQRDGRRLHAQTRWFAKGAKAYAISWVTSEIDWGPDLATMNMVLSSFSVDTPAGS